MNADANARIGPTLRMILRLDAAAWLLALLALAVASPAFDRSISAPRDPLLVALGSPSDGVLPSAVASVGERTAQVEERQKRLERILPSSSGGPAALAVGASGPADRAAPPPAGVPDRATATAGAADAFDARAPPRPA